MTVSPRGSISAAMGRGIAATTAPPRPVVSRTRTPTWPSSFRRVWTTEIPSTLRRVPHTSRGMGSAFSTRAS